MFTCARAEGASGRLAAAIVSSRLNKFCFTVETNQASAHTETRRLRLKSVWSIETFAVDEILPESFLAHFKKRIFFGDDLY